WPSGSCARSMVWIVVPKSSWMAGVCPSRKEPPMQKRLSPSLLLACLVLLLTSHLLQAQGLPVFDAANLTQNTVSAIQAVLTTIEAVLIEANQVLELTKLDGLAAAPGLVEDMLLLGQLVEQATGLSYDINSIQSQIDALFNLTTAPS